MKDIEIVASAKSIPSKIVTNEELSNLMDTSDEWIQKRTGIKKRHISTIKNTSDLASDVAMQLLNKTATQASEIDLIIVATMSPDNMTPATAAMVQGAIGARRAIAFDISAACSGFSYAIAIAHDLMVSNNLKKAIVIGSEVLSKMLNWHDRTTAVLFGDGAGGVLLNASAHQHLLAHELQTFGELGNKLIAGHTKVEKDFTANDHVFSTFEMDGREVYRFATHKVPDSIKLAIAKAKLNLNQIDYYLLHQANVRIIKSVARNLKQPLTKFPVNIDEYGNTAAASEAILLAECMKKNLFKKGDIISLSGFGGGLTAATIIYKF
ncbi:ketoacyl-ACP synthase III [Lactobacillus sp. PV037]|uniref:beta-ketoacyl-ACP synthase III n=1 Tax=Lactobacillus sp. PV037 TaxID=2594496 RepID=UPI00223FA7CA|nr:beta-ketoacyl-ACP synthase III [Lactobacillus sp. PV037]QNQ83941.1 ketoacyl-ACP synthase III [Lactobacillus sp. PV037]